MRLVLLWVVAGCAVDAGPGVPDDKRLSEPGEEDFGSMPVEPQGDVDNVLDARCMENLSAFASLMQRRDEMPECQHVLSPHTIEHLRRTCTPRTYGQYQLDLRDFGRLIGSCMFDNGLIECSDNATCKTWGEASCIGYRCALQSDAGGPCDVTLGGWWSSDPEDCRAGLECVSGFCEAR